MNLNMREALDPQCGCIASDINYTTEVALSKIHENNIDHYMKVLPYMKMWGKVILVVDLEIEVS